MQYFYTNSIIHSIPTAVSVTKNVQDKHTEKQIQRLAGFWKKLRSYFEQLEMRELHTDTHTRAIKHLHTREYACAHTHKYTHECTHECKQACRYSMHIRESNWQKFDEVFWEIWFHLVSMLFSFCLPGIMNIFGWDELIKNSILLILKKFISVLKTKTLIFIFLCLKD